MDTTTAATTTASAPAIPVSSALITALLPLVPDNLASYPVDEQMALVRAALDVLFSPIVK